MSILSFKDVSLFSDNKTILKNVSFDISSGDFVSIVGPSGSGKSTLLRLCCHLISPSKGKILYNDRDLFQYNPIDIRKNISLCFQNPYLFGNTVMDNIKYPYSLRNLHVDINKVNNLLESFNLERDILNQSISKLSGGEKQRISIIRTLLFTPDILLLDEITSALDTANTLLVENTINKLNENNTTILWVTHNLKQSRKYANKIFTIEDGELKNVEVIK